MIDPTDPLERLPQHDVSSASAERIRRRVHGLLAQRRAALAAPRVAAVGQFYHRFIEPAALIGLGLTHLLWALSGTLAVLGP